MDPAVRHIKTHEIAELNAAEKMRWMGFTDAEVTKSGPDGGIDVRSRDAVAQVKFKAAQTGRPELQNLYGARGREHDKQLLFFSGSSYSRSAHEYADAVDMALFTYDLTGEVTACNKIADSLLSKSRTARFSSPTTDARSSAVPDKSTNTPGKRNVTWGSAILTGFDSEPNRSGRRQRHPAPKFIRHAGTDTSTATPNPDSLVLSDGHSASQEFRAAYDRTLSQMRFLGFGDGLPRIREGDLEIFSNSAVALLRTFTRLRPEDLMNLEKLPAAQGKWKIFFTTHPLDVGVQNRALTFGIALFRIFSDGSIDTENLHARTLVDAARRSKPLPPTPVADRDTEPSPTGPTSTQQKEASRHSTAGLGGLYQNRFFRNRHSLES